MYNIISIFIKYCQLMKKKKMIMLNHHSIKVEQHNISKKFSYTIKTVIENLLNFVFKSMQISHQSQQDRLNTTQKLHSFVCYYLAKLLSHSVSIHFTLSYLIFFFTLNIFIHNLLIVNQNCQVSSKYRQKSLSFQTANIT